MKVYWSLMTKKEDKLEVYPTQKGKEIVIAQGDHFIQMSVDDACSLVDFLSFAIQEAEIEEKKQVNDLSKL